MFDSAANYIVTISSFLVNWKFNKRWLTFQSHDGIESECIFVIELNKKLQFNYWLRNQRTLCARLEHCSHWTVNTVLFWYLINWLRLLNLNAWHPIKSLIVIIFTIKSNLMLMYLGTRPFGVLITTLDQHISNFFLNVNEKLSFDRSFLCIQFICTWNEIIILK